MGKLGHDCCSQAASCSLSKNECSICLCICLCKHVCACMIIYNIYFIGGGGDGWVAKSCLALETPWTIAHQAPLSMGFSRQEYWSGLAFPSPEDLPHPGIKPMSPALKEIYIYIYLNIYIYVSKHTCTHVCVFTYVCFLGPKAPFLSPLSNL